MYCYFVTLTNALEIFTVSICCIHMPAFSNLNVASFGVRNLNYCVVALSIENNESARIRKLHESNAWYTNAIPQATRSCHFFIHIYFGRNHFGFMKLSYLRTFAPKSEISMEISFSGIAYYCTPYVGLSRHQNLMYPSQKNYR